MESTIYLIALLSVIASCNKDVADGKLTVTGTVINANTGLPIEGALIIEKTGNDVWSTETVIDVTDADGNYEVRADGKDDPPSYTSHYVEYQNFITEYLCYDFNAQQYSSVCNIELNKPSILKAYINNVSPYDSNDDFRCWLNEVNQSGALIYRWEIDANGSAFTYLSGSNLSDTMNRVLLPGKQYTIHYESTKNNIQTDASVDIFTTWNDTVELTIDY